VLWVAGPFSNKSQQGMGGEGNTQPVVDIGAMLSGARVVGVLCLVLNPILPLGSWDIESKGPGPVASFSSLVLLSARWRYCTHLPGIPCPWRM
jgi:hypothetical protein